MSLPEPVKRFPDVWRKLVNARCRGRLGHAYLLVGDAPETLEGFAREFAGACICLNPQPETGVCNSCRTCSQVGKGVYPAWFELRPQSKSRRILVEEIRNFEHSLHLTADPQFLKVGLIVDADRLNVQAQNAFLKTLEEPPGRTLLLLLTTQPRKLLPTVRSRCQRISLLTNTRDYSAPAILAAAECIARLQPDAGSAVALKAAARLRSQLAGLHEQAEQNVPAFDDRFEHEAEEDAQFGKRIDDIRKARVQAEYLRLRQELVETVEVWFMQEALRANGVSEEHLPSHELLQAAQEAGGGIPPPTRQQARRNIRLAQELAENLQANVDERLAVEAFCLAVCQRNSN